MNPGKNDYIYVTIKPTTIMKDSFFTLTFFPRKPRATGDGEYPIYVRITTEGQKTEFTIGRKVLPSNWDQRAQKSTGRSRRDIELNKYLEMVRSRFYEIHNRLLIEGRYINPQIMKNHYFGMVEKPKMLCDVFRETNVKRREEYERGDIGYATFSRWERCVTYLEEFMTLTRGEKDIPLKEVTPGFIQDFEHFLRMSKECANNTTVRYLRYLKNVLQYGIANKWISEDPFAGKRFRRTKAERTFLTEPELQSIMALDLKAFPRIETVRDTFVFCCFTGLAFIDVQTLRRTDISTDSDGMMWIRKTREKTDELSVIPLLDVPKAIMQKYENHPVALAKGVVLPVMSNQKVNAYLKELADLAKIQKHLTSHTARHTFATMSLNNHVPLETISKMLGHADIKTTLIYAKMMDKTISEDMEVMRTKFNGARLG